MSRNIHLIQYYIRRAQSKADTSIIEQPRRVYPENMKAQDVAQLLNVEIKTIRNWTNANKIPFLKLGTAVRYPKSKTDKALERGVIGRVKKKK